MCIQEPHKDNEKLPDIQAIEAYCHSELRRRSRGLGLQREEKQFTGDGKSKCLVNKCLSCRAEKVAHREDFEQTGSAEFPQFYHT